MVSRFTLNLNKLNLNELNLNELNLNKLNPDNIELKLLKDRCFNRLPKFVFLIEMPGTLLVITENITIRPADLKYSLFKAAKRFSWRPNQGSCICAGDFGVSFRVLTN